MAMVNPIKTSFLLGEASPRMAGLTDSQTYPHMLKKLENGYVTTVGGVQKRPGTQIRNDYTVDDFILESGPTLLATCVNFKTLYNRDFKTFPFKTSDGKQWIIIATSGTGDEWSVYDVSNNILRPLPYARQVNYTNTNFEAVNRSHIGVAWVTHTNTNVEKYQFEQAGDVLFITNSEGMTLTIRYILTKHFDVTTSSNFFHPVIMGYDNAFFPASTFSSTNTEKHQSIPWLEPNISDNYGNGALTFTWAGYPAAPTMGTTQFTITSASNIFSTDWVGSTDPNNLIPSTCIRLNDIAAAKSLVLKITSYVSTGTVRAVWIDGDYTASTALSYGTAANTSWEESAWSYKNGFPTTVAYFGSRILYGGTTRNPNRIWCSAVGDVDELASIRFLQDADYTAYQTDVSKAFYLDVAGCAGIRWMVAGKNGVFFGSENREFVLKPLNDVFTYASYKVDVGTSYGGAQVQAVKVSSQAFFVNRAGTRVRDLVFSFQEDDYQSDDLSEYAEHIVRQSISNIEELYQEDPSVVNISVQTSPEPRIWVQDSNGGLSCATLSFKSKAVGWARQKLGGTPIGGSYGVTNPTVAASCILPGNSGPSDELYLLVKRMVDSTEVVTMEMIGPYFDGDSYTHEGFNPNNAYPYFMNKRAVFLDCCQASIQAAATTSHGFSDVANETVSVVADGSYLGEVTLDGSGNLTLAVAAKEVLIGYLYDTLVSTMDLELMAGQGNSQARFKNVYELWLRFYRTGYCQVKSSSQSAWQTLQFVTDATPADGPVSLFSGDKMVNIGNIERNVSLEIKHRMPFPFELLALIIKAEVS